MRKILIFVLTIGLSSFSASGEEQKSLLRSEKEIFVLVDNLLQLTERSSDIKSSLAKYKEWEKLYIRIRDNAHVDIKHMSLYFFVVFIADARSKIHTQEEISQEILSFYNKDKDLFLAALNENPAFIPVVCNKIAGDFSFSGNDKKLKTFLEDNKHIIQERLYKPYADRCILELEKKLETR